MKKLALVLAIALIACFAVAGCQVKDEGKNDRNESVTSTETPASSVKTPDSGNQETPATSSGNQETATTSSGNQETATTSSGNQETATTSSGNGGSETPVTGSMEINFTANGGAGDSNFTLVGTTDKTTSGKTAKDGWLNGTKFSGTFPQLGKDTTAYGSKCIEFTTTGAGSVYVYATRGSSDVTEGNLYLINTSSQILATVHPVDALACYQLAIPGAGSYALATDNVSSINVFAIKVDGTSGGASGGNSSVGGNSSAGGSEGPAQTGSFEINFTANGGAGDSNFTLVGTTDKTTSGKTAKDGWLSGTKFSGTFPQLGKGTTAYGSKCIEFTTTGACDIQVYATRGSSDVTEGNLYLIDNGSATIDTVHPVESLACYTLHCSAAGSYALATDNVSSINIFAIKVG